MGTQHDACRRNRVEGWNEWRKRGRVMIRNELGAIKTELQRGRERQRHIHIETDRQTETDNRDTQKDKGRQSERVRRER